MKTEWNLSVIYKGLDDPAYEADMKAYEEAVAEAKAVIERAKALNEKERVELLLTQEEKIYELRQKLGEYVGLAQSVDTTSGDLMAQYSRLMKIEASYKPFEVAIHKIYAEIEDMEKVIAESELAGYYAFRLRKIRDVCLIKPEFCSEFFEFLAEPFCSCFVGVPASGNVKSVCRKAERDGFAYSARGTGNKCAVIHN